MMWCGLILIINSQCIWGTSDSGQCNHDISLLVWLCAITKLHCLHFQTVRVTTVRLVPAHLLCTYAHNTGYQLHLTLNTHLQLPLTHRCQLLNPPTCKSVHLLLHQYQPAQSLRSGDQNLLALPSTIRWTTKTNCTTLYQPSKTTLSVTTTPPTTATTTTVSGIF